MDHGTLPPKDDPKYFLDFRYPEEIDPDGGEWSVGVSRATYDDSGRERDSSRCGCCPTARRGSGWRARTPATWCVGLTVFADLVLLGIAALTWRFGGTIGRRPDLRMVATDDVQRCKPGAGLEQVGDLWVAKGEVVEKSDDTVVLDLGDRRVVVELAGFANPVGYQQPAQAVGRMIG